MKSRLLSENSRFSRGTSDNNRKTEFRDLYIKHFRQNGIVYDPEVICLIGRLKHQSNVVNFYDKSMKLGTLILGTRSFGTIPENSVFGMNGMIFYSVHSASDSRMNRMKGIRFTRNNQNARFWEIFGGKSYAVARA